MSSLELKRDPDGKRYVRPYLGTSKVTGKPMRPYLSFSDDLTDEECLEQAEGWLKDIFLFTREGAAYRLDEMLLRYIKRYEKSGKFVANTARTYRTYVGLLGPLGEVPVKEITVLDIEDLYDHLLSNGGVKGQALSRRTVAGLHQFLRGAWEYFVSIDVADKNPVVGYKNAPTSHPEEARALTEDEYQALVPFIESGLANGSMLRRATTIAVVLSLNTGLRCGEVCALLRSDVSLDELRVHVGATVTEGSGLPMRQRFTKSKKPRNVELPAELADVVRRHYEWQNTHLWRANERTPLVTVSGACMRPSAISREFKQMLKEANLPSDLSFHNLRHTHASWLIARGIDAKTVSERLGHADVATTLRIYSHVMPGRDRQAADTFSEATRGLP